MVGAGGCPRPATWGRTRRGSGAAWEWCWGERDHRTAVYCEVPSAAMVEEPD